MIDNSENNKIQKRAQEILSSAAQNKIAASSLSAKLRRATSKEALLIDVSGSMCDILENAQGWRNGKTKYQVMLEVLLNLGETSVRRFEFASHVNDVTLTSLSRPAGGTNLAGAIAHCAANGIEHIILITDGLPDSEHLAIAAVEKTKVKLDIIYIGPDPVPDFLKNLGEIAKGSFDRVKLAEGGAVTLMTSKIKGLLT